MSGSVSLNKNRLIVRNLKLTQFRNYEYAAIDFHPKVNALTGLNGMGKTNVLDALYYLCLGKSYFTSGDRNVIMQHKDFFRLDGEVECNNYPEHIVIKVVAGSRKEIISSGVKAESISDHIGKYPVVIIAPDDIQHLLEGSEPRRNFLNNTIIQTNKSYLEDILLYNALLKRRNAMLKEFQIRNTFDTLLLESITAPMLAPAQRIYVRRKEESEKLSVLFEKTYNEIAQSYERCTFRYESQLAIHDIGYLMDRYAERDRILGRTTQGIHKDDLVFMMNEEPVKNYASQGQLKSFVLSLKMAQYAMIEKNTSTKPVLLLDDIFDKLDTNRVQQLLRLLVDKDFGQIFITDTNHQRITDVLNDVNTDYKVFQVEFGKIE